MRTGVPCNENRFFPVRISTQGKSCSGPVLALFWHCTGLQCRQPLSVYDEHSILCKANNLRSNLPWNHLKNLINFPSRKKTREISFHKCRNLPIFAVITQLFSAAAHSFVALVAISKKHLRASRKIKKLNINYWKNKYWIDILSITGRSNECYKSHH